ncbi:16S rRNA (guanine(527)-N(7))-methyltransferase RsmG [Mycoplasmopsis alligatoris]|uniref:Ribosomal RNA small subunit methyltransferase G n=1 Tax=Mycoplasmopsis alligatoris A21JP2 TaxID=747682 RepID=D4XWG4_9BACT|nr:16S rRNA (guanine(527)-N(7))-methyltransferase RsmG [Mycoplasmopsis alligatoris]EFF41154.1 16S rRNA methyltransferase GidB [Mycoplasmopsis alligatoris A21JP2]
MSFKQKVKDLCKKNSWNFEDLEKYFSLVTETNKVLNLTGFEGDKLWEEGIYESLLFIDKIVTKTDSKTLLDIGAGAGFPSIPYAIVNKNLKITIYEPIKKRVDFLNTVVDTLSLEKNVQIFALRAEDVKDKNCFDLVTARAVGDVSTMLMSSFHLISLNGYMALIKGKNYDSEIEHAQEILKRIKTEITIEKLDTHNQKDNNIIWIKKLRSASSKFPYKWKDIISYKKKR